MLPLGVEPHQGHWPHRSPRKMGVMVEQIVDYKALCGDSSDNIPGVKGIGDKTAVKLLTEYGTLDNIYASVDQIKGAVQKKLITGKEAAYHSQFMARIVLDVPLKVGPKDFELKGFTSDKVSPVLEKLEFQSFLRQINQLQKQFGGEAIAPPAPTASPVTDDGDDTWFFSAEDTEAAQTPPPPQLVPRIVDTPAS
nr:5'-3' exonuclease H3TH domain-containing protein [Acaryochloris sp. CCMEE 5410]